MGWATLCLHTPINLNTPTIQHLVNNKLLMPSRLYNNTHNYEALPAYMDRFVISSNIMSSTCFYTRLLMVHPENDDPGRMHSETTVGLLGE